jgi:hypothetical protein
VVREPGRCRQTAAHALCSAAQGFPTQRRALVARGQSDRHRQRPPGSAAPLIRDARRRYYRRSAEIGEPTGCDAAGDGSRLPSRAREARCSTDHRNAATARRRGSDSALGRAGSKNAPPRRPAQATPVRTAQRFIVAPEGHHHHPSCAAGSGVAWRRTSGPGCPSGVPSTVVAGSRGPPRSPAGATSPAGIGRLAIERVRTVAGTVSHRSQSVRGEPEHAATRA